MTAAFACQVTSWLVGFRWCEGFFGADSLGNEDAEKKNSGKAQLEGP